MSRRSPRALALWGIAVLVAVVTAAVVAGDLATLHRRAAGLGPEVDAVVAARDLPVGRVLTARDVRSRAVHRDQLPRGVVVGRGQVVGRVMRAALLDGAYVTGRALAPRHRTGLDGVVPPGMRAMRMTVTDALVPRPGAAVDVLATYDTGGLKAGSSGATVVVASGVTVLGTDRRSVTAGSGRGGTAGVTLLVDPDQATELADAQAHAVVTLALVPPEDAVRP